MYWLSKSFHVVRRFRRRTLIFLAALGPGNHYQWWPNNDARRHSQPTPRPAPPPVQLSLDLLYPHPDGVLRPGDDGTPGAVTKRGHGEGHF